MKPYKQYLSYLLEHIKNVRYMCFREGLYMQGLLHDLSKFFPYEFITYTEHFYGDKRPLDTARRNHQRSNKHHWQYRCTIMDSGELVAEEMPKKYAREMLCDWRGCGKMFNKNEQDKYDKFIRWEVCEYYKKVKDKIVLHENTRNWIEAKLKREYARSRFARNLGHLTFDEDFKDCIDF